MTLIGALKCRDGFVIASDTAIELGDAVYHGPKIARYRTTAPDERYELFVACCGEMEFAEAASQQIRDALRDRESARTLVQIRTAIERSVKKFYDDHIWPAMSAVDARISLIMAVRNAAGEFGVFKTHHSSVKDSTEPIFAGTGESIAMFVSERLLQSPHAIPTAVAVHLFMEIFRTAKKNSAGVGRNTEIYAVRVTEGADRFFQLRAVQPPPIFSLESNLYAGIRDAFAGQMFQPAGEKIGSLLDAILEKVKEPRAMEARVVRWAECDDGTMRMETIDPYMLDPSL